MDPQPETIRFTRPVPQRSIDVVQVPGGLWKWQDAIATPTAVLQAPDRSTHAATRTARTVPIYSRVTIGYRTIEDAGDRLVLTPDGWRRLDSLTVGSMAVVRAGGTEPPITADLDGSGQAVTLDPKLHFRLVEQVRQVCQPKEVHDFDSPRGYEVNGVVVKTAATEPAVTEQPADPAPAKQPTEQPQPAAA